jgi:dTDP-4-amino-4,6-dideoxygalactose transaminase
MSVPFLDLGAAYGELRDEIDVAVSRSFASGWYTSGQELEAFEREFSTYTETRHSIGAYWGQCALSGLESTAIRD